MTQAALPLLRELTRIYEPEDPDVVDGTYDCYGFRPKERAAAVKAGQIVVDDGKVYRAIRVIR